MNSLFLSRKTSSLPTQCDYCSTYGLEPLRTVMDLPELAPDLGEH